MIKKLTFVVFVLFFIALVALVAFVLTFKPVRITGSAMEPSYLDGTDYLANKFPYVFSQPQRGEVVVFRYTQDPSFLGVSRIVGLPGEMIKIQGGKVYINGVVLNEEYLAPGVVTETAERRRAQEIDESKGVLEKITAPKILEEGQELQIPEENYFMMGDNRSESIDSRSLGFVHRKDIIGKIIFRYR